MRVLFWDICSSVSLLSTNQMEWVWCSESVQNQGKWASCFALSSTVLIMPVSAIQATLGLQGISGVSRTHCNSRIYCWCSALADVTISSTQSSTQLMHTVFHPHPPVSSAWYYSVQHVTHSCIKREKVQACTGGTEKGTNNTRALTTCQVFCQTLYKH